MVHHMWRWIMGKALSLDIRERVVALVDEGLSCHEAAPQQVGCGFGLAEEAG